MLAGAKACAGGLAFLTYVGRATVERSFILPIGDFGLEGTRKKFAGTWGF